MAENECLDLHRQRGGWGRVLQRMGEEATAGDIGDVVLRSLCQSIRNLQKFLREDKGLDLGNLVRASDRDLAQFVLQSGRQDYVELYRQISQQHTGPSVEREADFLRAVVGRFEDQISHKLVGTEIVSFTEARRIWHDVKTSIEPSIIALAKKRYDEPTATLRAPRGQGATQSNVGTTESMLGESVLNTRLAGET